MTMTCDDVDANSDSSMKIVDEATELKNHRETNRVVRDGVRNDAGHTIKFVENSYDTHTHGVGYFWIIIVTIIVDVLIVMIKS